MSTFEVTRLGVTHTVKALNWDATSDRLTFYDEFGEMVAMFSYWEFVKRIEKGSY